MNIAKQLYWISKIRSKIMCYNILHQFVFVLEISNCLPLPGHNITSVLNTFLISFRNILWQYSHFMFVYC